MRHDGGADGAADLLGARRYTRDNGAVDVEASCAQLELQRRQPQLCERLLLLAVGCAECHHALVAAARVNDEPLARGGGIVERRLQVRTPLALDQRLGRST